MDKQEQAAHNEVIERIIDTVYAETHSGKYKTNSPMWLMFTLLDRENISVSTFTTTVDMLIRVGVLHTHKDVEGNVVRLTVGDNEIYEMFIARK